MKPTIAAVFAVFLPLSCSADIIRYEAFGFISNLNAQNIDPGSLFGDWTTLSPRAGNNFALPTVSIGESVRIEATYNTDLPDSFGPTSHLGRFNSANADLIDFSITVDNGLGSPIVWSVSNAEIETSFGAGSANDTFQISYTGSAAFDRFDFELGGNINVFNHLIRGQEFLSSKALPPDSLLSPDAVFFLDGGEGGIGSAAGGALGRWAIGYDYQFGTASFTNLSTSATVPEPEMIWAISVCMIVGVWIQRKRKRSESSVRLTENSVANS